jgi:DNA-binding transcriptional regulator YhcF (GntR family)
MMIYDLGPKAMWVYTSLRERITGGEFPTGTKLPSHLELASEFGVAPLTLRQVLGRLEEEGLVAREQGRGTFVRTPARRAVLIVEDDPEMRALLRAHVERTGHRAITEAGPAAGLKALETDPDIVFVFSDVRMPDKRDGIEFIRAVRRRWPELPLTALTGFPDDLAELHGTPECPILILGKPAWAHQIAEALRLGLHSRPASSLTPDIVLPPPEK